MQKLEAGVGGDLIISYTESAASERPCLRAVAIISKSDSSSFFLLISSVQTFKSSGEIGTTFASTGDTFGMKVFIFSIRDLT